MTEFTTEFLTGTIYWAKVFKAVDNYEHTAKEWTFDLCLDDDSTEILKKHRLLDRLKEAKDPVPSDYIRLRKPESDKNGNKNDPITIKDEDGEDWGKGNIGNGSSVIVRVTVADFGKGKKKGIWTNAIKVTEHVPHEGGGQFSDPFAEFTSAPPKKAAAAKAPAKKAEAPVEDFEDDIPF